MAQDVDVKGIKLVPNAPGCPVVLAAARVPNLRQGDDVARYASGCGESPEAARLKCAREVAERTAAQFSGREQVLRGAMGALDGDVASPPAIMLFSDSQYEAHDVPQANTPNPEDFPRRWSPKSPIDWIRATSSLSTAPDWLPAGLCFLGHIRDRASGLVPADTNGLATGVSIEDAAVRGFVELVERDAVAIWWYNRLARPQIDLASIDDPLVHRYAAWTGSRNRPLRLIDLTHDCRLPVVAAVAHDLRGQFIAFGFGAGASASEAARHAVEELAQFECNVVLIDQRVSARGEAGVTPEALALLRWWREARVDRFPHLSVLPTGQPPASCPSFDLQTCQDLCRTLGLRFLAFDMTATAGGTPVVRVFAPGLRPKWPRFAPGRLFDVPVRLGWLCSPLGPSELNPMPMTF